MSVIIEKTPVLKNNAKLSSQKETPEDWKTLLYLSGYMLLLYSSMICILWIPLAIYLIPPLGIVFLLYICWIYYDRQTTQTGGRKANWFRDWSAHQLGRNYFSNRLIKTADLPEGRNYILGYYPHGLVPFSMSSNFMFDNKTVADLFPGIDMTFVTADLGFFIPILRDFLLLSGGTSCSEASFTYLLKSPPSKGIVVLPGGASEIKYSRPDGVYTIIKRKGFIRLALATGFDFHICYLIIHKVNWRLDTPVGVLVSKMKRTPLVPVFTFGETNAWNKVWIIPIYPPLERYLRNKFKLSVDAYVASGRGLLPKKVPVNTVVGAPISVPKVENPSEELIDEYYEKFFQALQDLFEQHKHEYDVYGEKAKLIMTSGSP